MNSKRIIKKYGEPIYANKFDNLDEMDNFLQNLHREIHTMDKPISKKKLNQQSRTFKKRKHTAQTSSLVNSKKHLQKKLYLFYSRYKTRKNTS